MSSATATMYYDNNSYNDNLYNNQLLEKSRRTASYRLKKILKPLLRMLKQNKTKSGGHYFEANIAKHVDEFEFEFWPSTTESFCCEGSSTCEAAANNDNAANEALEARIVSEMAQCDEDAAVYVYNEDGVTCNLQPVQRAQQFVPVHFARTNAGTFFWTTMAAATTTTKAADCDLVQPTYCCSHFQQPELQYGDRWVQA